MRSFKPIIGLEIHVELATLSKMFCGCPADHFGKPPNTQTCPTCLGLPGALPVPNKKAIEWTILVGLALKGNINKKSKFDRKHYFYPDLPKGYQISQYDEPLCFGGYLQTSSGMVKITRVHIEEDTGKLQHKIIGGKKVSLIDFNRSGVPLVEIVTEPDIHSAQEAKEFAQKLQKIIRYLGVSDCDMEKGSMRLEANTSWGLNLGYKVEIKNINSFRFLGKAVEYDLKRQKKILETGKTPQQETRGWNEAKSETVTQRYKETADDYRYFPEPDIPPMIFSKSYISKIKSQIPMLPEDKMRLFIDKYGINTEYAGILVQDKSRADYFEKACVFAAKQSINPKDIANLMLNRGIDGKFSDPEKFISSLVSKNVKKYSGQSELLETIKEVIKKEKKAVADYKKGNDKVLGFLIGALQVRLKGRADPKVARNELIRLLK